MITSKSNPAQYRAAICGGVAAEVVTRAKSSSPPEKCCIESIYMFSCWVVVEKFDDFSHCKLFGTRARMTYHFGRTTACGVLREILFKSQILRWPRTATSLLWCNFSVLALVTRHKLFLFWPSKLRILLPHYFISFRKDTHFEQE